VFEDIVESRNHSGLRGFVYRHLGKIADADQALDEIKIYSIVFFVLGGIPLVAGLIALAAAGKNKNVLLTAIGVLSVAVVMLTLTGLVRAAASRVGASLLFAIEVLNIFSPSLISILWAALAWRLVQATFAFHRFSRETRAIASASDAPPLPPPSSPSPPLPPPMTGA
jgi:hypothetical protein